MFARAHAFTIDGLQTRQVSVEVDVRSGLPAFTIVGLADAAVREARERIRAAIRNCGFEFPARRITANLAPGDLRKAGPGLDLALACALLAASGQIERGRLEEVALFGELSLDGAVRPTRGALAVARAAHDAGLRALALAGARAEEAALVEGLEVAVVERLTSAVRVLHGGPSDPRPARRRAGLAGGHPRADLSDVRGQHHAVRALVIAAAGGHNCLLSGAPGSGKTMLVQRLPGILPRLSVSEAIEVAHIHSLLADAAELTPTRPFRAPHHTITAAGLVGGAGRGAVGEVVLAHNGVLFLDELSEFSRTALEALRQPLEDGRVAIARATRSTVHPARFMLIAATNPCPCGHAGELERCMCSESDMARHRRRLSGPLLDRIDLLVQLGRSDEEGLSEVALTSSARAREQVRQARERQEARWRGCASTLNSTVEACALGHGLRVEERGREMAREARGKGLLSARGEQRVLRVARTVADLRGARRVRAEDVGAALALRGGSIFSRSRAT